MEGALHMRVMFVNNKIRTASKHAAATQSGTIRLFLFKTGSIKPRA